MPTLLETIEVFRTKCASQQVPAGTVIFKQNDLGDLMYGIVEGEVDVLVNGNVVETLKAGEIFGQGALVDPEYKRLSTTVAKTDCQLVSLDKQRFMFAVQETPMFALAVMREYSKRLRHLKTLL